MDMVGSECRVEGMQKRFVAASSIQGAESFETGRETNTR
jgi:hypothetical protein